MKMGIFKEWKNTDVRMLSPLKLAYIGDAVYEVYIRRFLLENSNENMGKIHKKSTKYVSAKAQSDIVFFLDSLLTDEEKSIIRRGRNTKSNTVPKNANIQDYKYATGFEALIGYLYLNDRIERIEELMNEILAR
ncbi:MAG: Mini-ribonuclease 3 [Andreesenia angusta]|nr:Mini-ribonuclease 3 [Andreesenia angusta]